MNDKPTYIIAEIGINHNGSLDNCRKMIDNACDAGCDCVKVQFFKVKDLYPRSAGRIDWKDSRKKYSYDIFSAVKSFELPDAWIKPLIQYCKKKEIDFLSSVFDEKSAKYLIEKGVKALKLPSSVVTHIPLIDYCARFKVPLFLSTGAAILSEIDEAVNTINRYHNNLSILHCSLSYPTKLSQCNLGIIDTLKRAFPKNRVGYSDHTTEISTAAVQSVYLGAKVIEKHTTLNRNMKGPDHFFALEPSELKKLVSDIREAEKDIKNGNVDIDKTIYGSSAKVYNEEEKYLRDFCYMSIFARKNIRRGSRIKLADLQILRPGKKKQGLDPKYISLFKEFKILAAKDIAKEDEISWEKIFNA